MRPSKGSTRCPGAWPSLRGRAAEVVRLRLFVAVWIPEVVAQRIWDRTAALRGANADVRWTPPSRYHVTLRFLGEVDADRAPSLPGVVDRAAGGPPFPASVRRVGAFRRRRRPPVFWAGVEGPGLGDLRERLDQGLSAWGMDPEPRPFRAHITLGRGRGRGKRRGGDGTFELEAGTFMVDRIVLVESALHPSGARYTTRYEAPLGGGSRDA